MRRQVIVGALALSAMIPISMPDQARAGTPTTIATQRGGCDKQCITSLQRYIRRLHNTADTRAIRLGLVEPRRVRLTRNVGQLNSEARYWRTITGYMLRTHTTHWTPDRIKRIVRHVFAKSVRGANYALCIVDHESGYDPNNTYLGHYGLFQFSGEHHWVFASRYGWNDPWWNSVAALRMSNNGRDWGPWSTKNMC